METFEEYCKDFIVDNLDAYVEQMSMVAIYQAP